MCGRYSFVPTEFQITQDLAGLEIPGEMIVNYNIAPTQPAYVITNDEPGQLQLMTWGLIPHWSRDGATSGKLINARCEGVADKASFRTPIRRRRCLVPADSFYEWREEVPKRKIPYRILRPDKHLLFFAGLWDEWRQGTEVKRSFSIITGAPSPDVVPLHDRMPIILADATARARWLERLEVGEAVELLQTPREGLLSFYRVSEKLNSPSNNGPVMHEEAVV